MKTSKVFHVPLLAMTIAAGCWSMPASGSTMSPDHPQDHPTLTLVTSRRQVKTDQGLTMQPDSVIRWMMDDKLGMFIHWGLYSGVAKGEWVMENKAIPINEYRKYAFPVSGDEYFDASHFDPNKWMEVAKSAGARYVNMTTEHHDGYALFESHYPNAFTSVQTHGRDFVKEYVEAARAAGMRVGLYKTLINWRYPGYYDVTGKQCAKNKFGYVTAPWHKENAREMKEELYCQTRELMTQYGRIDQLFWDGGWLAQKGSDADAAYFWEPGKYLSADNEWPVSPVYQMKDSATGRPLGLMGMVRALQPGIVANLRSGWIGDYTCEEGSRDVSGPVREGLVEKCMTLTPSWGFTRDAYNTDKVMSVEKMTRIFADCLVRNMCLLINVGPDRHGDIPPLVAERMRDFGQWVQANSEAIFGTRGGPWQPVDKQYGFTCRGNKVYLYLLHDFEGDRFSLPLLGESMNINKAYFVDTKKPVTVRRTSNGFRLSHLKKKKGTLAIVAIELNQDVASIR